jgi:hypothetical protein
MVTLYEEMEDLGWDYEEMKEFGREIREWAKDVSREYNTISAWYLAKRCREKGLHENADMWEAYVTRSADYYEWASGWKIVWDDRVGRFRDVETGRFVKPPFKPVR